MQIDDSALEVHDQDQPYTLDLVVWVSMRFPLEGDDRGYVRGCTVIQTEIGTLRRCPKHAIRAFRSRILFRSVPWYKRVFVARTGWVRFFVVERFGQGWVFGRFGQARGPVVSWSLVPWSVVPWSLVLWSRGPLVSWSSGPAVLWSRGPPVPHAQQYWLRAVAYSGNPHSGYLYSILDSHAVGIKASLFLA